MSALPSAKRRNHSSVLTHCQTKKAFSESPPRNFFQARRTAQWIDQRTIHLQLDDRRLQVCSKLGHTLWPQQPWEKGKVEEVRPYHMTLAQCNWRWVRSVGIAFEDFRQVIGAARVSAGEI